MRELKFEKRILNSSHSSVKLKNKFFDDEGTRGKYFSTDGVSLPSLQKIKIFDDLRFFHQENPSSVL